MDRCAEDISNLDALARAQALVVEALAIIDTVGRVPGDIGAYLDLVLNRLQKHVEKSPPAPWDEAGSAVRPRA